MDENHLWSRLTQNDSLVHTAFLYSSVFPVHPFVCFKSSFRLILRSLRFSKVGVLSTKNLKSSATGKRRSLSFTKCCSHLRAVSDALLCLQMMLSFVPRGHICCKKEATIPCFAAISVKKKKQTFRTVMIKKKIIFCLGCVFFLIFSFVQLFSSFFCFCFFTKT